MSPLFACLDASGRELHRGLDLLDEMAWHRATPTSDRVVMLSETGKLVLIAFRPELKPRAA